MNPYEISTIIEEELPSVNREIKKLTFPNNPYKIMAALSSFAKKCLERHDLPTVVKCLQTYMPPISGKMATPVDKQILHSLLI